MENTTYRLHEPPKQSFFRRSRMKIFLTKIIMGAVGACIAFVLIRSIWAPQKPNLKFPMPSRAVSTSIKPPFGASFVSSPRAVAKSPLHSTRKPELDAKVFRYGPFMFGGGGLGSGMVDIFDVFDQLYDLQDFEDTITANRRIRQAYEEELTKAREERQRRRNERGDRVERRTKEPKTPAENHDYPVTKTDIEVTRPLGMEAPQLHVPALNTNHNNEKYSYTLDIQGMNSNDIKVSLQNRIMIVEGNKMVETDNGYHSSTFKRSFTLPYDADLSTLKSVELEGGRLLLEAQKLEPEPNAPIRQIAIERLPSDEEDGATKIMNGINQNDDDGISKDRPNNPDSEGMVEDVPPAGE